MQLPSLIRVHLCSWWSSQKPVWLALATWWAIVLCWAGQGVLSGLQGKRRNHIMPSFCFHLSLHPGIWRFLSLSGPLIPSTQSLFSSNLLSTFSPKSVSWISLLSTLEIFDLSHLLSSFEFSLMGFFLSFFLILAVLLVGKIKKRKCSILHVHWKLWHIAFLTLQYTLEILIHTQHKTSLSL